MCPIMRTENSHSSFSNSGQDLTYRYVSCICNSCACVMLGRGGGREGEGRGLAKFENLFHISLPIANASFHLSPWKPLTAIKG